MQLSFECPDFTYYLHKQATSRIAASQLSQIALFSKPSCLENMHSKHILYKRLSFAERTSAIEEQERGFQKSLLCFLFHTEITNR